MQAFEPKVNPSQIRNILNSATIKKYAIPFKIPGPQVDRQILHYLCVQGSNELSGFFNTKFWSRLVLQQSQEESVVRQALVSLGSLHLQMTTDAGGSEALTHYGKALRMLARRLGSVDSRVRMTALTCSILFHCFEAAAQNYGAAARHLQNGLNLLAHPSTYKIHGEDGDFHVLSHMFETLDVQATLLSYERPRPQLTDLTDISVDTFSTLDEAQQKFIRLQNRLLRFVIPHKTPNNRSLPTIVSKQKIVLMEQLNTWLGGLNRLAARENQDEATLCGIDMLLLHWKALLMILDAEYSNDSTVWNASPNSRADEVLDLAESIIERTGKGSTLDDKPRLIISSATGFVVPLFVLAMNCLDENSSSRALKLLETSHRQEGFYSSQVMAKIVRQFRPAGHLENSNSSQTMMTHPSSRIHKWLPVIPGEPWVFPGSAPI